MSRTPLSSRLFGAVFLIGLVSWGMVPAPAAAQTPPTAVYDSAYCEYDGQVVINVLANDGAGTYPIDPTTVTIVEQPLYGDVVVNATTGAVTYIADTQAWLDQGTDWVWDSFRYTVRDTAGNTSSPATVDVEGDCPVAPVLLEFTAMSTGLNIWHFRGRVSDEHVDSCTIIFGGLLTETCEVNPDGTFWIARVMPTGGIVSAKAKDRDGLYSNVREVIVGY